MKEIKIIFGKGGRTQILAPGQKGQGTAQFTEKLAKDLGEIEERHKAQDYTHTDSQQQINQGH